MTPDIKRILYATDLSDNSAYAFGYALNLAKKYDAEITILHVIYMMMGVSGNVVGFYFNEKELEENMQKRLTHVTEEINKRLKVFVDEKVADHPESADKVVSIEVCQGYPADEILKKADELHCDLIVMGTHGKGIVGQAFFGSVAKRVLRRVRKPVFIIPLPEER
ncbi:universal stress protein [Desulfosarcina sp.]|uniref:universal stress protein n=1 Tax=Desulfosarcina sp. TaxID=2027861 RepID=UPI0029B34D35|nr:universal stress protein [Desulfosarcina sp.]MDX2490316.1 universal stress protein [Desulfosarcina sp.]